MRRVMYLGAVMGALLVGFVAGGYAARDERDELMQLDREFDEAVARGGSEAWASYFAEDGIMLPNGGAIVTGRQAIQETMNAAFSNPKFVLRWEPLGAAASGNMGFTYGLFRTSRPGADGKPVLGYGKYLTVWRKQRGGWKIVADCGNNSPPPQEQKKK
ncbi:MAG TPA: DUF4440 domain-containing protein [Bryobacteraceae bacterium]|nr:DUF4440 domain-containing protein [Bryobacteraceae bacterium]